MNQDTTPQEETLEAYMESYEREKAFHEHTAYMLFEEQCENKILKEEIAELKYYIEQHWKAKGWKQEL